MSMAEDQRVFVLVHGAWHGGWCWRRVADNLRARGHVVYTPTLTGLADRSHLMSSSVTLRTHADDVINLIRWERLENVCLVGHSYGGFVTSLVAEEIGDKLSSFVFLDAFAPEDGEDRLAMINPAVRAEIEAGLARGDPGRAPPPASYFKVRSADDIAWVDSLMTPQPNGAWVGALKLTGARDRVAKKSYIRAGEYPSEAFDRAMAKCRAKGGWECLTLAAGHDVMVDAPAELADALVRLA
jgi:pimeloyl-ACP methyl ester carboxylesterase